MAVTTLHAQQTLYLPLDGSLQDIQANVSVSSAGLISYRAGHKGKALRVGGLYASLKVPVEGVLNAREGSVAMWVAPVDWRANDKDFHVFFDARGDGALVLYKYFEDSRLLFLATRNINGDGNVVVGQAMEWAPGTWKHLVATWSHQGIRLFVNGLPVAELPTPADMPKSLVQDLELGDLAWGRMRTTSSLIDEVRLFDHALTSTQVERLYRGLSGPDLYAPFGQSALRVQHDATTQSALLLSLEWSHDVALYPSAYTIEVFCPEGTVGSRFNGTASSTLQQISVALPVCQQKGGLRIVVNVADDRGQPFVTTVPIDQSTLVSVPPLGHGRRPSAPPELAINMGGVRSNPPADIPAPWSAPVIDQRWVSVWGRRFDFSHGPLARQIASQELPLVPAPIQLLHGESSLTGEADVSNLQSNAGGEVVLKPVTLMRGGVRLVVSGSIAYDGLYQVRLRANEPLTLTQDLRLRIPLTRELPMRWHKYTGRALNNTGALPQRQGTLLQSAYTPYLWVGNKKAGLFWFAESDRFWPNASRSDALRIQRTASDTSLLVNIASAGTVLPKGWQFDFGLMPTPVRPVPEGKGSRLRIAPLSRPDIDIVWPEKSDRSFRFYGYPEAHTPPLFDADLRRRELAGAKVAPYLCPTYLSVGAPEWRAYGAQWSLKRFDSTSTDVMAMGGALALVSPRAPTWRQFFADKLDQFLEKHQPRALYYDNVQLYGGAVPEIGVGYTTDQGPRMEYPLTAYRQLFHSLAKVADRRGATTRILHGSGQLTPMMTPAGTYFLNGEQYLGIVEDSYLKILSLAEFRQQFSTQVTGALPLFIPEFDRARQAQVKPTHELMGLLLVHDVPVWPIWVNVAEVEKTIDALERSVPQGSRFIRYDDPLVPATANNRALVISAHVAPGANPLLVALNTGARTTAQICMKNAADAAAIQLSDRLSGEHFRRSTSRCYRVDFPARSLRLLRSASNGTGRSA